MRIMPSIAATLALGAGVAGYAPTAAAGHLSVGIGIGLPGIALIAPGYAVRTPYYYYAPGYYPAYYPAYYPGNYAAAPIVGYGLAYRGHPGRSHLVRHWR
jgi:hypothetical protein